MKTCAKCRTLKSFDAFSKDKHSPDGHEARCRDCRAVDYRERKASDPEAFKQKKKGQEARRKARDPEAFSADFRQRYLRWRHKKEYGLTASDYEQLLKNQNGVCAICGQPEKVKRRDGTTRPLHVDHCHASGKVRGLLCHGCNTAIGLLREDVSLFYSAISYLQVHGKRSAA